MPLQLTGDANNAAQDLTEAEVNHLRRLLAWIRCEYLLGEDMQRGMLQGLNDVVAMEPATQQRAQEILDQQTAKITAVPAYVRQAVKMLSKAVRKHDAKSGVIES